MLSPTGFQSYCYQVIRTILVISYPLLFSFWSIRTQVWSFRTPVWSFRTPLLYFYQNSFWSFRTKFLHFRLPKSFNTYSHFVPTCYSVPSHFIPRYRWNALGTNWLIFINTWYVINWVRNNLLVVFQMCFRKLKNNILIFSIGTRATYERQLDYCITCANS